jgi:hypothetical protein
LGLFLIEPLEEEAVERKNVHQRRRCALEQNQLLLELFFLLFLHLLALWYGLRTWTTGEGMLFFSHDLVSLLIKLGTIADLRRDSLQLAL